MEQERELKCKFDEKNRKRVEGILEEVLIKYGFTNTAPAKLKEQFDTYYDTNDYQLAQKGESLRVRETKNSLVGTYKSSPSKTSNMFSRREVEFTIQRNSALALLDKTSEKGIDLPKNIKPAIRVENQRVKAIYENAYGVAIEVALDEVINIDLETLSAKEATKGELEIEFDKNVKNGVAEAIIKRIWLGLLGRCTQEGISLEKSQDNKYVSGLKELGLMPDASKDKEMERE